MRSSSPIDELSFRKVTESALKANDIMTVGQLMMLNRGALIRLPGIGRRSLTEIQDALAAFHLGIAGTSFEGTLEPEPEPEIDKGPNLRDYFAAKAMQGIVGRIQDPMPGEAVIIAHQAYLIADAMLEARK